MVFDQKAANLSDAHMHTELGRYIFYRQTELILDLLAPHAGERVLDVGCGSGSHLGFFRDKWCSITGIDPSAELLEIARTKLGSKAELALGQAEDLPFSDDEFDIVTLINVLEMANDPHKVIAEAIRVCRNRVFIGFLNNYSFVGTKQRLKEIFGFPISQKINFFRLNEIKMMVENIIGDPVIKWGSVIYFPSIVYSFFEELEELLPVENNPFGAFIGLTFPVKYIYRTVQSPVMESFKLKAEAQVSAPGTARNILQETHK
jgi:ubiquinone/menaquinone biosynthesis C-methylase UbiE